MRQATDIRSTSNEPRNISLAAFEQVIEGMYDLLASSAFDKAVAGLTDVRLAQSTPALDKKHAKELGAAMLIAGEAARHGAERVAQACERHRKAAQGAQSPFLLLPAQGYAHMLLRLAAEIEQHSGGEIDASARMGIDPWSWALRRILDVIQDELGSLGDRRERDRAVVTALKVSASRS